MSLSSEMRPRAEKVYSMEVKDIFGELLEKASADIIYEELEVLAADKALTNCINILIKDNFNTAITKEISKLPFTQSSVRSRADVKLISKEINRALISKTVIRIIKKMSKEMMQIGYFGYLIYKGLLSKLTRRFAIISLFNAQCKDTLLKGTTNAILMRCMREMIEAELAQLLNNQQDSECEGLGDILDLASAEVMDYNKGSIRELEEEFENVLAGRKNYNRETPKNRSLKEEFDKLIPNNEYNASKSLIDHRHKKSFE
jgi:hypothetical protein